MEVNLGLSGKDGDGDPDFRITDLLIREQASAQRANVFNDPVQITEAGGDGCLPGKSPKCVNISKTDCSDWGCQAYYIRRLLNDRSRVADNEPARPLETIYHAHSRQVDTLFGVVELRRNYYNHTKAHTGRYPLDEALDLVRGHPPGLARIISRASTHSGSYDEAQADLHAYLGLHLTGRNFGRLVAEITPALLAAQATLPPTPEVSHIPILYVAGDGTGVPLRRSEVVDVKGKQPDGTARTREAKLDCVFTQTSVDDEGNPCATPIPPPTLAHLKTAAISEISCAPKLCAAA